MIFVIAGSHLPRPDSSRIDSIGNPTIFAEPPSSNNSNGDARLLLERQQQYTFHHDHHGIPPYERAMRDIMPSMCPKLLQPRNVHFMVINLDRSIKRLQRMTDRFNELQLPMFERIPGIEVVEGAQYDVAWIRTFNLQIADFGCAIAHRAAWKAAANGPHEWSLILEDDTQLISKELLTEFPPVPYDCDFVMLRPETIVSHEAVCNETSVRWAHWGYGTIGYLVHRDAARRLLAYSAGGFNGPIDGHLWFNAHQGCITVEQRLDHTAVVQNDPRSVRKFLNGEADHYED